MRLGQHRGGLFTLVSFTCAGLLAGACSGSSDGVDSTSVSSEAVATSTSSASVSTSSTLGGLDSVTEFSTEAPPGSVRVDMTIAPNRFLPDQLTVPAGDTVFFLVNTAPEDGLPVTTHTLAIGPSEGEIMAVSSPVRGGESASFSVKGLAEGEYVIWCTFFQHAAEGMVGTLTVE